MSYLSDLKDALAVAISGRKKHQLDHVGVADDIGDAIGTYVAGAGGGGGGGGTVTSVASGDGLAGGPITGAGTLAVDASVSRTGHTHAAADIAAGTAGINISGNAATATLATSVAGSGVSGPLGAISGAALTGLTVPIVLCGVGTVNWTVADTPWQGILDAADYPTGRDLLLEAVGTVTRSGITGTITLYNLTDSTATATLTFAWTGSATPAPQSAAVILSSSKRYELRRVISGYSSSPDALALGSVALVVR